MDEQDYISLILYYGRLKFFNLMQKYSLDGLTKYPNNLIFRLFNGISLILGNRIQEGIRELNPLKNLNELSMATILCLIYAHKRCTIIDKETIYNLDIKLKDERKKLTTNSAYYSAIFLFLIEKYEKSKEYTDKSLKLCNNNDNINALILKGWIELYINSRVSKNLFDIFELALLKLNNKNIDAILGQVRYYQINNDYENAIILLNKLSIRYPELNIPLIEKMEIQLSNWNWDYAYEISLRILNLEPINISALRCKSILLICYNGKITIGLQTLYQLFSAIEKIEMNNTKLLLQTCQLFSKICGRNYEILLLMYKNLDKIIQLIPDNVDFITEMGYLNILMGHYKEATKCFRSATKVDDSSIYALCGLTLCQMAEYGLNEQVHQQIEFLNEIQGLNKIPLLLYMTSKIAENDDKAIDYLIEACEIHFKNLKTLSFGHEYLLRFDPDFLLQIVNELLQHSPVQSIVKIGTTISKETLHISLKQSLNILEAIIKACPGLINGIYMLAKVQFLCGDITLALNTLNKILNDIDPTYSDAHILFAQIQIQQKQFKKALQNLEICLSHNFQIRDKPLYHLLNGIVQKNQQQYDDAQKSFIIAMNLIGIKHIGMTSLSGTNKLLLSPTTAAASASASATTTASTSKIKGHQTEIYNNQLALADKVTLFLELIDTYMQMGLNNEAEKLMQNALEEFSNTTEEGRLAIANAEIILKHGNINKSIDILKSIQIGQQYYIQAKTRLANIYLHHRKDRLAFAQCFKELVSNCPEPESYLMLGDAYMSIQEPDLAIDAYKQALKQNQRDSLLASKLGRAYVKTHQYAKAINYYHEAIMNPEHRGLKLDLSELYLKLRQYSNAEQILSNEIDDKNMNENDITELQIRTKQLLLLARIREKSGNVNSSLGTLREAKENQYRVQNRLNVEQVSNIHEQYKIISKICVLMAEQFISIRENDNAITQYKEALRYSPHDITVMASLAKLYMQMNLMDDCRDICSQILQIDSNNEVASVMMADISFRKVDFHSAAYHFSQLLISQPTYWTALARLIEVMRRSGTLMEANEFLLRAEHIIIDNNPLMNAGYNYCKGLYEWYNGNPNGALRYFNNARRDSEWGQQAVFNMIEICLNPDGDLPSENIDNFDDVELKDSRVIALKTANRLLKELQPRNGIGCNGIGGGSSSVSGGIDNEIINCRLLKNFLHLGTRQKFDIETALNDFTEILSKDEYKEMIGPIYGVATSYILLKQSQKARNILKRIIKNTWNFEEAEYLERCWLLLADLYIQNNKYDMAQDLLKKVLKHNKSCVKAYEFLGYISEKEQSYKQAAINYDFAWKYGGKSKPQIGYKLAYNHMKTKRYADAVSVCQEVLKMHPDYPSIKKDILDKCRNNLRC